MTQRQQYAVVPRDWLESLAAQKPEKPDHWSSCSQCERATDSAQEFIARPPPDQVLSDDEMEGLYNAWRDRANEVSYDDLMRDVERSVLQHLQGAKNG